MKRNKNQDWTRVLQERLQDAQLPAPDDFASWVGQKSPAFPARSPKIRGDRPENGGRSWPVAWWPWALGSVAVAALAGILFLRTPDNHSRLNPSILPVVTESPAPAPSFIDPAQTVPAPAIPAVLPATPVVIPAAPIVIPAAPIVIPAEEPESPAPASSSAAPASSFAGSTGESPAASSKTAPGEDEQPKTEVLSSNQAQDEDGTLGQARKDEAATPSPSFADLTGESPVRRKPRLALRLHAASVSSTGQQSSVNPSELGGQPMYTSPNVNTINPAPASRAPAIPLSFGVSAELSLSRHWSLVAGLDYTQRNGYRVYANIPQPLTLHYLGIPLEAHYIFWPEGRFRVYLGAGAKVEKSFLVTGGEPLNDPFLFSMNIQAGADVRILPGIRLYLSPVFSGYLTHSAYANTWDNRPQFSLRVGLSFDL